VEPANEKAAPTGTALVNHSQTDITKILPKNQVLDPYQKALQASLVLAGSGFPCFPCNEEKKPACPHGFKDANTNADELRVLWERYPGKLIGVPTGAVSGFDALDVDPRHGGDQWLNANAGNIPPTRTHRTRSGGWHLLFRHRAGMRNSAGKIAPGVDVRADGGYIIWWPATGLGVENDAITADWPKWLAEELLPPPRQQVAPLPRSHCQRPYIEAALCRAMQTVVNAPDGSRNHTLNSEAWSLARFIPSGELGAQQIATALSSAALAAGLSRQETIRTIASALRARGV